MASNACDRRSAYGLLRRHRSCSGPARRTAACHAWSRRALRRAHGRVVQDRQGSSASRARTRTRVQEGARTQPRRRRIPDSGHWWQPRRARKERAGHPGACELECTDRSTWTAERGSQGRRARLDVAHRRQVPQARDLGPGQEHRPVPPTLEVLRHAHPEAVLLALAPSVNRFSAWLARRQRRGNGRATLVEATAAASKPGLLSFGRQAPLKQKKTILARARTLGTSWAAWLCG